MTFYEYRLKWFEHQRYGIPLTKDVADYHHKISTPDPNGGYWIPSELAEELERWSNEQLDTSNTEQPTPLPTI